MAPKVILILAHVTFLHVLLSVISVLICKITKLTLKNVYKQFIFLYIRRKSTQMLLHVLSVTQAVFIHSYTNFV